MNMEEEFTIILNSEYLTTEDYGEWCTEQEFTDAIKLLRDENMYFTNWFNDSAYENFMSFIKFCRTNRKILDFGDVNNA